MITRRGFLKGFTAAIAGAAVATKVPAGWLPTETLRKETSLEYLRQAYHKWMRASGTLKSPRLILVGRSLFEAVESEMVAIERFCWAYECRCGYCGTAQLGKHENCRNCGAAFIEMPVPNLMFKGTRLRLVQNLKGWDYVIHG